LRPEEAGVLYRRAATSGSAGYFFKNITTIISRQAIPDSGAKAGQPAGKDKGGRQSPGGVKFIIYYKIYPLGVISGTIRGRR
jgi:hypothetical protein